MQHRVTVYTHNALYFMLLQLQLDYQLNHKIMCLNAVEPFSDIETNYTPSTKFF